MVDFSGLDDLVPQKKAAPDFSGLDALIPPEPGPSPQAQFKKTGTVRPPDGEPIPPAPKDTGGFEGYISKGLSGLRDALYGIPKGAVETAQDITEGMQKEEGKYATFAGKLLAAPIGAVKGAMHSPAAELVANLGLSDPGGMVPAQAPHTPSPPDLLTGARMALGKNEPAAAAAGQASKEAALPMVPKTPAASPKAPQAVSEPPPVGAAVSPKAGPVTRKDVLTLEQDIYNSQGRKNAAELEAAKVMRERGPMMTPEVEQRLYKAGERDPSIALSPEEQQVFDTKIAPVRVENKELLKDTIQRMRRLNMDGDLIEEHLAALDRNMAGYMPRINKAYARELPGLTLDEVQGGMGEYRPGVGRGVEAAPSTKSRTYFTVEDKAGVRTVVHHEGDRLVAVDGSRSWPLAKGQKPEPGMELPGKQFKLDDARTGEIEAAGGPEYVKHATGALQLQKLQLTRMNEDLKIAERMKDEMVSNGWATHSKAEAKKAGMVSTQFPGLANTYVDPRLAQALKKFEPYKRGEDVGEWLAGANRFLTGSMFFNPVPHLRNVLELYMQDRGLAILNPAADARAYQAVKEAYKSVTTQDKFYQDVMTHGGVAMSAKDYAQPFFDTLKKEVLAMEPLPVTQSIASKLGTIPVNLVKGWYGGVHKALWAGQDILTLARIKERMLADPSMRIEEAVRRTMETLPDYRTWSEMLPHPEAAGRAGRAMTAASQVPEKVIRSQVGRMTMNFSRYYYNTANSIFGPYVRTLKNAQGVINGLRAGDKAAAAKQASLAAENISRIAGTLLVYQAALPVADKAVQAFTGDQRARMTRWGAMAVMQALDDVLHGRGNKWETARLLIFSPSPLLEMASSALAPAAPWEKNKTIPQKVGGFVNQVPAVNIITRPFGEKHPLSAMIEDQLFGMAHRPSTPEEKKQDAHERRMKKKAARDMALRGH